MTAAAPTADQEDLLSLVLDSTSTEQLAHQLATRTAEQCARMLHALKDFLSTLSRKAGVGAPKAHLAMLVAALETTPAQVASVLDLFACSELSRNREALDAVTASLTARGPQWCEQLASHLLSRRDRRIEVLAPVLHPLLAAHDLPLPEHCGYWAGWVRLEAQHVDSPRWAESFLAACAASGAFAAIPTAAAQHYAETASSALARVRAREGLDDVALLRALLRVFERGDRPGVQRAALAWLRALDLEDRLVRHCDRLIGALPQAHSSVVTRLCPRLLEAELDDEALTSLALTVLAVGTVALTLGDYGLSVMQSFERLLGDGGVRDDYLGVYFVQDVRLPRAVGSMLVGAALGLLPAIGVTALAQRALAGTLTAAAAWGWVAAIAVGLMGGHMIYLWGTGYAHRVELRFRTDLRRRIAVQLARLPLGWHTEESSGRVRSTITEDTAKVHTLIAHFGSDLGLAIGAPVGGLIYLLTRSWPFALVLLAWLVVTVSITGALSARTMEQMTEAFTESEKQLAGAAVEMVDGIAAVKAFGLGERLFGRFSTALERYTRTSYEWMRGPGRPMAVLSALMSPAFMLVPIMATGWVMAGRGMIEPVGVLPFLLVGVGLPSGVMNLASLSNNLIEAQDAARRIGELLAEPVLPEPPAPVPVGRDADGGVGVVFDHVSFRYRAGDPLVLDDVHLELRPGTVTAVVGPSGGGKSTLVRLAARFWDVESGSVRLGGTDVRDASSQDLLSCTAIVLQEGGILADTAEENIRLARPGATREEVEAAARAARAAATVVRTAMDPYDCADALRELAGRTPRARRTTAENVT